MIQSLNKSLLRAFVDEFVEHSKSLLLCSFGNTGVAAKAFPGSVPKNAKARLSATLSPTGRPLTRGIVNEVLNGCREALTAQYGKLGKPAAAVAQFEEVVCRKLRFPGPRATADNFHSDALLESAHKPEDLGLPDIVEWLDGSYDATAQLNVLQSRSIEILRELIPMISRASTPQRRLDFLQIALSIGAIHHPGTRWHESAYNLANSAADDARLLSLTNSYGVDEALKQRAHRLMIYLHWLRISPTLDSPTNYARYVLNGNHLAQAVCDDVLPFLNQAQVSADRQLAIDPTNPLAIRERSSILSMKARLLVATGKPAAIAEADRLHKQSLVDIEQIPFPYGLAYPVLKDIVQGKFRTAIRKCESAIITNQTAEKAMSAHAFAALYLHLTAIHGAAPTADRRITHLARQAIRSASTSYQCSHIFDAGAVRRLLPKGRPPSQP